MQYRSNQLYTLLVKIQYPLKQGLKPGDSMRSLPGARKGQNSISTKTRIETHLLMRILACL